MGQRFPGWGGMVDKLVHDVGSGSHGSTFARDVEPWLGDSAAFAVTSVDTSSSNLSAASGHYVLAVASTDDGAAKDALAREDTADGSYGGYTQFTTSDHSEAAVGEGMVLVANDADTLHLAIDTRAGKGDDITSDDGFSAALAGLPAESLVRGWVNTQKLAEMASLATLRRKRRRPDAAAGRLAEVDRVGHVRGVGQLRRPPPDGAYEARAGRPRQSLHRPRRVVPDAARCRPTPSPSWPCPASAPI